MEHIFDDHNNDPGLEPGPNAMKLYENTKISGAENKTSQLKISKGVAEKQYVFYKDSLELLIRTLRAASLGQRLCYLFTGKIPQTELQRKTKGWEYPMETYDDWLKH